MWKLKNQLVPKERDPPMVKMDNQGNLIQDWSEKELTNALKSYWG